MACGCKAPAHMRDADTGLPIKGPEAVARGQAVLADDGSFEAAAGFKPTLAQTEAVQRMKQKLQAKKMAGLKTAAFGAGVGFLLSFIVRK
jgi:hypothetical protein